MKKHSVMLIGQAELRELGVGFQHRLHHAHCSLPELRRVLTWHSSILLQRTEQNLGYFIGASQAKRSTTTEQQKSVSTRTDAVSSAYADDLG
ncbi:hypothetical protein A3K89_22255 [Rhodococcoides kyotonense]|uniref:Uncharacterized protein n=1 Tax=Rhodococcoides kyotonense TaxID=398843 RepID=A0A177YEF8_9NOCA|nr:hypothetical protein A3K89_22255 [Rhodococcus kyotonensis]